MKERDRNFNLMLLMQKLHKENDVKSIELLKTFVDNDTMAMQKSFELMTKSSPISQVLGINNLSELGNYKGVDISIDSEDFKQWMIAVDDNETDTEKLYEEYLEEIRKNYESYKNYLENRKKDKK